MLVQGSTRFLHRGFSRHLRLSILTSVQQITFITCVLKAMKRNCWSKPVLARNETTSKYWGLVRANGSYHQCQACHSSMVIIHLVYPACLRMPLRNRSSTKMFSHRCKLRVLLVKKDWHDKTSTFLLIHVDTFSSEVFEADLLEPFPYHSSLGVLNSHWIPWQLSATELHFASLSPVLWGSGQSGFHRRTQHALGAAAPRTHGRWLPSNVVGHLKMALDATNHVFQLPYIHPDIAMQKEKRVRTCSSGFLGHYIHEKNKCSAKKEHKKEQKAKVWAMMGV